MSTTSLPQENDSQRIGADAVRCFVARHPNGWRTRPLDGDDDAGFDQQVQIVENGTYVAVFRAQIKGTTRPDLNATGEYFSLAIDLSTWNYYLKSVEPILIVFCDLSTAVLPRDGKLYYVWFHHERDRINSDRTLRGETVTLRFPVCNELLDGVNFTDEINKFREMLSAAEKLERTVSQKMSASASEDRIEIINGVTHGLSKRSSALIEELSGPVKTPWPQAPNDSVAGRLRDAASRIGTGSVQSALKLLTEVEAELQSAEVLEKAEYWFLKGRLHTYSLEDSDASAAYLAARNLAPDVEKYMLAWAEAELRIGFKEEGGNDFSELINKLPDNAPDIVAMRARLLAAEGKFDEAFAILATIDDEKALPILIVIASMQARDDDVISLSSRALESFKYPDNTVSYLYILRAVAHFNAAVNRSRAIPVGEQLPPYGPAKTNFSKLVAAWQEIQKAVPLLQHAGWPSSVDFIADIWSSTAIMLSRQDEAFALLESAATSRPGLVNLQIAFERLAAERGKWSAALAANDRQPNMPDTIFRRIFLLYEDKRHPACVETLDKNLDYLPLDNPQFPLCISIGITAADNIIRPEASDKFLNALKPHPQFADYFAVISFYRSVSQNPLNRSTALSDFQQAYDLNNSRVIGIQLFHVYSPYEEGEAKYSVQIGENLKKAEYLSPQSEMHLAQAYVTLEQWDRVMTLCEECIERFPSVTRFGAMRAFALDKLGHSAKSVALLKETLANDADDDFALSAYFNISARSGFFTEAVQLLESLLAKESKRERRFRLQVQLFGLVMSHDPLSGRGMEIAWQIGQTADRNNEQEEGAFLVALLTSTNVEGVVLSDIRKKELDDRIASFTTQFPNSKLFWVSTLDDQAPAEDLIKQIERLLGRNDEAKAYSVKLERQLSRGEIAFPFAWRPVNVLPYVHDVPALWEIAKRSKRDAAQYHLSMVMGGWQATPALVMTQSIPLLDLTALFVIQDLELFNILFLVYPKIAISQSTLLNISRMSGHLSSAIVNTRLKNLQAILKLHFAQILQPAVSSANDDEKSERFLGSELKELVREQGFALFSDDLAFRIYSEPSALIPAICTLDLLYAAEERGHMTVFEVARCIAKLVHWNVAVVLDGRHLTALISDAIGSSRTLGSAVESLDSNEDTKLCLEAIWNVRKKFVDVFFHMVGLLHELVQNHSNELRPITAITVNWYSKVVLRTDVEYNNPLELLASLIVVTACRFKHIDREVSMRLKTVYMDSVASYAGSSMDQTKEAAAIQLLGRTIAETEKKENVSLENFTSNAFNHGTKDWDLFINGYNVAVAQS